jgi:hypothetical protein
VSMIAHSESSMSINCWSNLYCVPADHPAPQEVQLRLDGFVSGEIQHACRRALKSTLDDADSSVWLLREILIDLAVDASPSAELRTSVVWGEQLASEIRQMIERGANGSSSIRFPDRASYLAQWVRDMASGHASDKWYYSQFDSLRILRTGTAIAEGILREPGSECAQCVLLLLASQNELEPVLAALHESDASRLFDHCLSRTHTSATDENRWVSRLLALWNSVALGPGEDRFRNALRLFAAVKTEWPGVHDAGLRGAIDGMLALQNTLSGFASAPLFRRFLHAAAMGRHDLARQIAMEGGADGPLSLMDFIARASGGDENWATLVSGLLIPAESPSRDSSESFLTELGGIFLLVSSFADLNIDEAMRAAAQGCDDPLEAEPVLRLLLAVRCLGQSHASASIIDPALRAFAALDSRPTLAVMAEINATADIASALGIVAESLLEEDKLLLFGDQDEESLKYFAVEEIFSEFGPDPYHASKWSRIASAILRRFARGLPGFAHSTPEYLFRNFLAGTSSIRVAADRLDVQLPQSPLALVLRISGAYRSCTLPWREGVDICLRAPSD